MGMINGLLLTALFQYKIKVLFSVLSAPPRGIIEKSTFEMTNGAHGISLRSIVIFDL
jgi:hypothetical protein